LKANKGLLLMRGKFTKFIKKYDKYTGSLKQRVEELEKENKELKDKYQAD
jgi:cell division protein FtsB